MPSLSQRCVLAIGNTGNGKSFTATVFGAKNVKVGHSSKSETDKITVHSIDKGGFYIDTPGFDDSDEDKSDEGTVHSIYRKMMDANIQNLTTILWFVVPDVRAKSSYKRQARFIESLAKYHNGNVWDNTIIVMKGDTVHDGPRDAAREIAQAKRNTKADLLSGTANFQILLFESLQPTSVYVRGRFTSDELNEYGIFKESEPERILAKYESLMEEHLKNPIRLDLKKVKCSKCSEVTDKRFASPKCHELESFHPDTECIHGGNLINIHPSSLFHKHPRHYVQATTRQVFDDRPEAWTTRVITLGILNPSRIEFVSGYWECCKNNDVNAGGCKQVYRCCERDDHSSGCQQIYDGCRHKQGETPCIVRCRNCKNKLDTNGCKEKCRNCKSHDTRNIKGCMNTSHRF